MLSVQVASSISNRSRNNFRFIFRLKFEGPFNSLSPSVWWTYSGLLYKQLVTLPVTMFNDMLFNTHHVTEDLLNDREFDINIYCLTYWYELHKVIWICKKSDGWKTSRFSASDLTLSESPFILSVHWPTRNSHKSKKQFSNPIF